MQNSPAAVSDMQTDRQTDRQTYRKRAKQTERRTLRQRGRRESAGNPHPIFTGINFHTLSDGNGMGVVKRVGGRSS